jgi:ABC-type phosphate transport system ATPase subunit
MGKVKDRLKNLATPLSVGQQQPLAMARTLAVGPKILLMTSTHLR